MRVQAVPSLRLYGFTKRKTKRIRLRRLALLIMRVGFIVATALLLAQPFISTKELIPLPPVAGEHEEDLVAAIIIDDSISSIHADDTGNRLDHSKAAVRSTLNGLPKSCGISFCLTSSPYPSPIMSKDEALGYIDRLSAIPYQGNTVAAIRQVVRRFAGQPLAILVSSSRNGSLWELEGDDIAENGDIPLYIYDTSETSCPAYLINQSNGRITLGGNSSSLKGQPLQIRDDRDTRIIDRRISAHEALLGELSLEIDVLKGAYWVATIGDGLHPWQSLYFRGQSGGGETDNIVIVRNTDEQSIRVDQLITGILLSFHRDEEISHYDPSRGEALPEATMIVMVGQPSVDTAVLPWFEQRLDAGVRILALPTENTPAAKLNYPEFLPTWSEPTSLAPDEYPLILENSATLPADELTTLEIRQMKPGVLCAPRFKGDGEVILRTRNRAVLTRKQLNPQSVCWALGTPLTNSPGSVAWHPAFPFLIDKILFPYVREDGKYLRAEVGTIVRLDEWFGPFSGEATLMFPDGTAQVVHSKGGVFDSITIELAGAYSLRHTDGLVYRVANARREDNKALVEKKALTDALKGCRITWVNRNFTFPPNAFQRMGSQETGKDAEKTKRYDLSQLVFWALLIFVVFEAALSFAGWRQRPSVSQ